MSGGRVSPSLVAAGLASESSRFVPKVNEELRDGTFVPRGAPAVQVWTEAHVAEFRRGFLAQLARDRERSSP